MSVGSSGGLCFYALVPQPCTYQPCPVLILIGMMSMGGGDSHTVPNLPWVVVIHTQFLTSLHSYTLASGSMDCGYGNWLKS